ncbi:hypothetical protein GCM10009804_17000 [Kribbella hippodromi]|uniref:Uncharacterized protein n=1 Tax=Kribbella hippodromi TaxID=434347 RepID=A0ABP4NF94_9ACTN
MVGVRPLTARWLPLGLAGCAVPLPVLRYLMWTGRGRLSPVAGTVSQSIRGLEARWQENVSARRAHLRAGETRPKPPPPQSLPRRAERGRRVPARGVPARGVPARGVPARGVPAVRVLAVRLRVGPVGPVGRVLVERGSGCGRPGLCFGLG